MPITIRASEAQREQYVQNILSVWHSADPRQMAEGRSWYRTAHKIALLIGDSDVRIGAGVIAALSVQKTWDENLRLARLAAAKGRSTGHVADCIVKANAILNGEDPEKVLPMRRKTGHFYRCIVNPADAEAVCVDRHAHDVMVGERYGERDRGLGAHGRYELVAECYREAARRLHEIPQVAQAVTWTVWTDRDKEGA
jgi:hypothetical protein